MRRTTIIGTAASAALILALSGCGGSTPTDGDSAKNASASSAPAKDAAQTVADAFKKSTGTNFKFELIDADGTQTGVYDAKSKGLSMTGKIDGEEFEMIFIGTDFYMKGFPPPNDKKWVHIDLSQAAEAAGAPDASDPLGILGFLTAATDVEAAGEGKYKGTFDLTKAATGADEKVKAAAEAAVKKLGDRAKAVPFEVTLDGEGRVTRYKVDMPTEDGKTETMEMKASDFGTEATVAKPAASETIELKDLFK